MTTTKDKNNKRQPRGRRTARLLWIVATVPFGALAAMLLLTAAGVFGQLPTFEELENPQSDLATELYSEDGRMIGMIFAKSRSFVDYNELNDSIVWALVSTEDARYYSHSGIDFVSLARVAFKTVGMGQRSQGGGSTITQQLAKNLFPRDTVRNRGAISKGSRLMVSKLKEWITAVKLERNYTKEEIIAMYLNTMDFSSNAVGVKAAAQTYFNKRPAELNIGEAATLVGIVNATTRYNPHLNPENAMRRRNTIFDRMRRQGFITRAAQDSLSQMPIVLDYHPISHDQGSATYFRMMLAETLRREKPERGDFRSGDARADEWNFRQALELWESNPLQGWVHKKLKPDGSQYDIYRDGLKIYTTIDSDMQQYAEQALSDQMREQVQPMMDRQYKNSGNIYRDMTRDRQMAEIFRKYGRLHRDVPEAELRKRFETPAQMKIFTYGGDVDTLMTPRDSLIHYQLIMRSSFVAMDPSNGHVKAYVGGPDYRYFQYDMASQGRRQVGSTIKPFIYSFGIDHLGLDPCTPVRNIQYVYETPSGDVWEPGEAGGSAERVHTGELRPLWWGLANSRNNYSVWIMRQSKEPEAVADFIHGMGVHSYIDPVAALALGTAELSLWELVGAYGTFANRGVFTEPMFVTRIEDRYGNVISNFTPATKDAIGEVRAYTMIQMLRNVVDAGTANRLRGTYGFTGEMAGKTGTSNDNRDAWFVGVTPKLIGGAWVGADDQRTSLYSRGEGSVTAMPIFAEFLEKVYANPRLAITQGDRFGVPAGATTFRCPRDAYFDESGEIPAEDEFFD